MMRKLKETLTRSIQVREIKSTTLDRNAQKFNEFLAPENIRNKAEWVEKLLEFPQVIRFKDIDGDGRISHQVDAQITESGVKERVIMVVGYGHMPESEFRATINNFFGSSLAPIAYPNNVRNNLSPYVILNHVEQLKVQCLRGALQGKKYYTGVDLADPRWLNSAESIINEFLTERKTFTEARERFPQKHEETIRKLIALCTTIAAGLAAHKEQPENLAFMLSLMVFVQAMAAAIRMQKSTQLKKLDDLHQDYLKASFFTLVHQNKNLAKQVNQIKVGSKANQVTSSILLRYAIEKAVENINPAKKEAGHYTQLDLSAKLPQALYTLAGEETGSITTNILGRDKRRTYTYENPGLPLLSLTNEELIHAAQTAKLVKNNDFFSVMMTHPTQNGNNIISLIYQDFEAAVTTALGELHPKRTMLFETSKTHTIPADFKELMSTLKTTKTFKNQHATVEQDKQMDSFMAGVGKFLSILIANGALYPILLQDPGFIETTLWFVAHNFGSYHSANYSPPKVEDRYPVLPTALHNTIEQVLAENKHGNSSRRLQRLSHV